MFYYAFLYCQFYLTSLFFLQTFSPRSRLSWNFYLKKKEEENARHTQSCWLVALLSCNNWVFTPLLMRAYFCYITRSNNIDTIFVVLRGCEQLVIVICDCWLQEATTTTIIFVMLYCNGQETMTTFSTLYHEGASKENKNSLQERQLQRYDDHTTIKYYGPKGHQLIMPPQWAPCGATLTLRFEQVVSWCLYYFLGRFYMFWDFQVSTPSTRYVFYVGIQSSNILHT